MTVPRAPGYRAVAGIAAEIIMLPAGSPAGNPSDAHAWLTALALHDAHRR
jgi:hypothetical protein